MDNGKDFYTKTQSILNLSNSPSAGYIYHVIAQTVAKTPVIILKNTCDL